MHEEVCCQACGARYAVKPELRRRQLQCRCGTIIHRPGPATIPPASPVIQKPPLDVVKPPAPAQAGQNEDLERRRREQEILAKVEADDAWRRDHLKGGEDTSFHSDLLRYLLRFFRRL